MGMAKDSGRREVTPREPLTIYVQCSVFIELQNKNPSISANNCIITNFGVRVNDPKQQGRPYKE